MFTYLLRMYQYHRKENKVFFLSLCMGVVLLQFVETFMNDGSFMEHYAVVSDVMADMMRLLDVMIIMSTVIFTVLSHWYFFRNQAKEYKTFQYAGMTRMEAVGLYLLGFLIVDALALVIGILFGSVLANLCYELLIVGFHMSLELPLIHLSEVVKVAVIAVTADGGAMLWVLILSLGKKPDKVEKAEKYSLLKCITMITIVLIAIALVTHWERDAIFATLALILGIFFLDIGMLKFYEVRAKKKEAQGSMRFEKAIKIGALKHNQGVILTAGSIFSLILAFTIGFFLDIRYWDKDVYSQQNPFDLVIANYEVLPDLTNQQIDAIIKKAETPITYKKEIKSIRDGAFSFFSVDDVNDILHTNYQVEPGKYIQVFRVYGRYQTKKDFLSTDKIEKDIDGKTEILKKGAEVGNILFGYNKSLADQTILLNQNDFRLLQEKGSHLLPQDIYLYQFEDWKKTGPVITELKHVLGEEEAYRAACSKIEGYRQVKEGYLFFAVTMVPILCGLFLFGYSQFRFAVRLELEKDEKEFYRLHCLGIGNGERCGMMRRLKLFLYTKPYTLAVLNALYFVIWVRMIEIVYLVIQRYQIFDK